MEYRVIDADSHIHETEEVWRPRLPDSLKDRAPRMVELEGGRIGWSFDGSKTVKPLSLLAAAGLDVTEYEDRGTPRDRIRPASHDPNLRLEEMEYDMVQAQVIYPSIALTGAHLYSSGRELQLACVRAYNDWLHDFCSIAPDRLIGLPIAPMTGVEDLLLEWRRVAERGARGIIMSTYPNGGNVPLPEDELFWSEIQDWQYAVHIHFGFLGAASGGLSPGAPAGVAYMTSAFLSGFGANVFRPLADIIYGGLFEKYPRLKVVAVETGIGWIPHYTEWMDDNFLRHRFHTGVHLKRMPSEYFKENIWATFITDPHGIESRHQIGVDHIMWSSDYPHSNSDWPNSQRTIAYELRNVPEDERRKIVRDNAAKLYGLG